MQFYLSARSLALATLLATALPAAAGPTPPATTPPATTPPAKQLTAEEQARLKAIRDEARAAEKKGDYAAAAAAYEKAIAIQPNNDRLYSERGWQLFLAKDLVRAEEVTRKAIALAGPARPASLYNLGRILETKNDKAGAAKAYQESLAVRPNRIVQQALLRVDPAAASQAKPTAAPAGDGNALGPEELATGGADKNCRTLAESKKAAGAITKAQVVACGEEEDDERKYVLVLYVGGQSFHEGLPVDQAVGGTLSVGAELRVDNGLLVVTLSRTETIHGDRDKHGVLSWMHVNEEHVEVCGVGASRKPSCTPWFQFAANQDEDDAIDAKTQWTLKMTLARDSLTLDADKKSRKKMVDESRKLLGRHPLVFP